MKIRRLATLLLPALLLAGQCLAYTGVGAVWGWKANASPTPDYTSRNFAGTSVGLLDFDSYVGTSSGMAQLGPGTETLAMPTYRAGVGYMRMWYTGLSWWGTPFEVYPRGNRALRVDSTGVAVTGRLTADSIRVGAISTASRINVKTWGAKGDGVTNDTAPVLAAYSALPDGGTLYFPTGAYLLPTWPVQTTTKVITVEGDGMQRSVVRGTGSIDFLWPNRDVYVRQITFDTWRDPFEFSSVTGVLNYVLFDHAEITNSRRAISASNPLAGVGIRELHIDNSRVDNMTSYGIHMNLDILEDIWVTNTRVHNVVERGISFGNNTIAFAQDRGKYNILNCVVDSVTGTGAFAINGIILHGWRAVIDGCHVSGIVNPSNPLATDVEAIYTKCLYSTIINCTLRDGGQSEAWINAKGGARNETVVQPHGYAVSIVNNKLFDTQTNPTLAGGGRKTSGIKVATSEVQINNNQFYGLTDNAIYFDSDTGSDAPCHNVDVSGNIIKDHRGNTAIGVSGRGSRIRVYHNLIDGVTGSFDPSAQNFGIHVTKKEGTGLDIEDNRIYNITDTGHTPVAVSLNPGITTKVVTAEPTTDVLTATEAHTFAVNDRVQFVTTGTLPAGIAAVTTYYVKTTPSGTTFTISATLGGATLDITTAGTPTNTAYKLMTLSDWVVADNKMDTARYGVQFTYDETYITVDGVLVRHNTGRNINGTTPPAVADLIKYSDTPTNLLDISTDPAAVAYEATGRAALEDGVNPQEFVVYGTKTDASNYERLSVRMTASEGRTTTEAAGTGAARPYAFGSGTNKWRVTNGGALEPMTDATFDFGTIGTARPRQLNAVRAVVDSSRFLISMQISPILFAALGTPGNGMVKYCADCTKATPCAGAGTGAFAYRINGAWDCNP